MSRQSSSGRFGTLIAVLAVSVVLFTGTAIRGGTITYLGQDTSTLANWRTAATAKPAAFDPNGDDVYGSDGYHVAFWTGTSGPSIAVQSTLPGYVGSVVPTLSSVYGAGGYEAINDPSAAVQPTNNFAGLWHQSVGTNEHDLFDITLTEDAFFVLGVISDTHDQQNGYNLDSIRARQTTGGTADTGLLSISRGARLAYYEFFEISGVAGDVFTISGRNSTGGSVTVTGVTFEQIPEPSTLVMLLGLAGVGLLGCLRRRRQT
jgi:hypothetical protein